MSSSVTRGQLVPRSKRKHTDDGRRLTANNVSERCDDVENREQMPVTPRISARLSSTPRIAIVLSSDSEEESQQPKYRRKSIGNSTPKALSALRMQEKNARWAAEVLAAHSNGQATPSNPSGRRVVFSDDEKEENDEKGSMNRSSNADESPVSTKRVRQRHSGAPSPITHNIVKSYDMIRRAMPRPTVDAPARAIRPGRRRLSLPRLADVKLPSSLRPESPEDSPYEKIDLTSQRRSRSDSFRHNVPENRLILDTFKLAKLNGEIRREPVNIDSLRRPRSHLEQQLRVSAMAEKRFKLWKSIRSGRLMRLEEAKKNGVQPAQDGQLLMMENIVLMGNLVDGSSIREDEPDPKLSRITTSTTVPHMPDDPLRYPGLSERFKREYECQFLYYPSEKEGELRHWKRIVDKSDSRCPRPCETFDIFENYFETVDEGRTTDPLTCAHRHPIRLKTRTPYSSPERRCEVVEQWRKEYPEIEGILDLPWPKLNHPEVINANRRALERENERTFEKLHDGLAKKLLEKINEYRKENKKQSVKLTEVKTAEELKKEWKEALNKFNKKEKAMGKMEVTLEEFKLMERPTLPEEKAIQHVVGVPWPPSIRQFLMPLIENGQAITHAMRNIACREEDYLAKMVMLYGAGHPALKYPLLVRLGFQRWENDLNKYQRRMPLINFNPLGCFPCEKEFNQHFGVCPEENLKVNFFYHPVLVIDPSKTTGSFMRLSVNRYPTPLPRGAVRVVVPDRERGEDFEEIIKKPYNINDYFLDIDVISIAQYHPLHPKYLQHPSYCYKSIPSAEIRKVWNMMKERKADINMDYKKDDLERVRDDSWPINRSEFMIWFEAERREYENHDGKRPFTLRRMHKKARERTLMADHPEQHAKLLAHYKLLASTPSRQPQTVGGTPAAAGSAARPAAASAASSSAAASSCRKRPAGAPESANRGALDHGELRKKLLALKKSRTTPKTTPKTGASSAPATSQVTPAPNVTIRKRRGPFSSTHASGAPGILDSLSPVPESPSGSQKAARATPQTPLLPPRERHARAAATPTKPLVYVELSDEEE